MSTESKYYYKKSVDTYSSSRWGPELLKWNKSYFVEVDEDLEYNQRIQVYIEKFKGNGYSKPKSSEYEKVRPVLEELFLDYYNLAIRRITSTNFEDGEIYLIKHNESWYEIEYYSLDEKVSKRFKIDFRDSVEVLDLSIINAHGHKGRHNARKKGILIKNEEFKLFYNLSLKFLSDSYSYKIYLDPYVKSFYNLVKGDNVIAGFDVSAEKTFKDIIAQLEERKSTIEKRLIESDQDTSEDRIKLRGELDGINYSISTINIHK